jgi:hypothetical protein
MEAMEIATTLGVPHPDALVSVERLPSEVPSSIAPGLDALVEAYRYARELELGAWSFAVEVSYLRHLGLSNSDLRWLASVRAVEYAVEITKADSFERTFRRLRRLTFSRRLCFILSPPGALWAEELVRLAEMHVAREATQAGAQALHTQVPTSAAIVSPSWDRNRLELRWGSTVVKRLTVPSRDAEVLLAAFEESGWPKQLQNPLGDSVASGVERLLSAVEILNRQRRRLIHFELQPDELKIAWKCE